MGEDENMAWEIRRMETVTALLAVVEVLPCHIINACR
jgi:hypothetical protein